uniref:Synuclein, alpha interacting protein n=1 Tax=Myripristis murdjan TaxID=586833 RepID=A0A667XZY9_9TELE
MIYFIIVSSVCIQTLVEYGSNSAERQGHTTCARYLVVVETCMSLASQVVKLTKQLNEQAAERMVLQNQLQRLLDPNKAEGTPSRSPGSHQPSLEAWPEMALTAEGTPGDAHWVVRQGGVGPDSVLRQLLGKDVSEALCPRERLPPAGGLARDGPGAAAARRAGLVERRELKLARLKQIMQRSLSESDSDVYPPEEGKGHGAPPTGAGGPRPDRPTHLPVNQEEPISNHLHLAMRKHLPSSSAAAERKLAFAHGGSKSVDGVGYNPSPTSSDPDAADGKPADTSADFHDHANGQKVATSPKSALKSPSSRRKTSQNLKLRVTFDEQVHKSCSQEAEPSKGHHGKERTPVGGSESKRPFGTFRSIMESLSGNTNHNNNNSGQSAATVKAASCQSSAGRKSSENKSPAGGKSKNKTSNV